MALIIAATDAICIKLHHWIQGVQDEILTLNMKKCKLSGLEQVFSKNEVLIFDFDHVPLDVLLIDEQPPTKPRQQ